LLRDTVDSCGLGDHCYMPNSYRSRSDDDLRCIGCAERRPKNNS
jgi:hypothetical protein